MRTLMGFKALGILIMVLMFSHNAYSYYTSLRFDGIDKQQYDSTCGVASLSHLLNNYFSIEKSELELLALFELKPEYSFADLAAVAETFEIETLGVKITPVQLRKITSPTILYLKRLGNGHFAILKGVDEFWVQIEDPAWGTLNYTHEQFNRYWVQPDGFGRALIFLKISEITINRNKIFSKVVTTH